MRRWTEQRPRYRRWIRVGLAAALVLPACAPIAPPVLSPTLPRVEPSVRVGILVDTSEVVLGATSAYEVYDVTGGRVLHRLSAAERVTVVPGEAGGTAVHVGRDTTSAGGLLTLTPSPGGMISIGDRQYRGTAIVLTSASGGLTVVNEVDMEAYLLGVVPYEIGRVGPELLEASRAQAVAARTYAMRYLGRRAALGFDVFATVDDQVYGGAGGEHDPISEAVRSTAGEILTFAGEPIEAFYHSTCSGRTVAIEEVWPIESPRPYLVSVVDLDPATGEAFDITSSRYRWTQRWSAELLRETFNRTLADSLPAGVTDVGEILGFETLEHTPSGRIRQMRITTSAATFEVGADRIRWIFLTPAGSILNSARFEISTIRDQEGRIHEIVADGMGWGHGIGMCQVGAMGRARAGQHYREILGTYYPGTSIVRLY